MCSLDICSQYTNILVAKIIDIILDNIFTNGISIYKSIKVEARDNKVEARENKVEARDNKIEARDF